MAKFDLALAQLGPECTATFGPCIFKDYLSNNGLKPDPTAPSISVDSLGKLAPELRNQSVMVFRLGSSGQKGKTQFALARSIDDWRDFFILDKEVFKDCVRTAFIPSTPVQDIFAFQMLPTLTESSYVNLALASGVLGHALELDEPGRPIVPAAGQCNFTFEVKPRSDIPAVWEHIAGQVQVDALFFARKQGLQTMFVVEAKQSGGLDSLAKHKLVYPFLGLRRLVPSYIPIVPVYLRAVTNPEGISFHVAECEVSASTGTPCIADLTVKSARELVLPSSMTKLAAAQ